MARKEKAVIPQHHEELTPGWFTSALDRGATVTTVDIDDIGTGVGFMGELYRCRLDWDRDDEGLPASVIVKVPSTRPENRALGEALRAYEREIEIYQGLHDDLGVPMPGHHYSVMDPDPAPWLERPILFLFDKLPLGALDKLTRGFLKMAAKSPRRYLLVLEDIDDAQPPAQVDGGSIEQSAKALEVLAGFHAANWMRQTAVDVSPRIQPLNTTPRVMQATYRRNRDVFVDQWGSTAGAHVVAKLDDIQDRFLDIVDGLSSPPWTLVHGDYRLDNVLYRPGGDVKVIDYQAVGWGRAGFDVAYFVTTTLSPDHREHEEPLLRAYHDALVDAGIDDYSFEQLVDDCEASKGVLAHRLVGGRDMVDTEMDGHDDTLVDMLASRVLGWLA